MLCEQLFYMKLHKELIIPDYHCRNREIIGLKVMILFDGNTFYNSKFLAISTHFHDRLQLTVFSFTGSGSEAWPPSTKIPMPYELVFAQVLHSSSYFLNNRQTRKTNRKIMFGNPLLWRTDKSCLTTALATAFSMTGWTEKHTVFLGDPFDPRSIIYLCYGSFNYLSS